MVRTRTRFSIPPREARVARSGNQPGDPAKAGRAITELIKSDDPPAHLLLGPDALEYVSKELNSMQVEFANWEAVTRSTNFDLPPRSCAQGGTRSGMQSSHRHLGQGWQRRGDTGSTDQDGTQPQNGGTESAGVRICFSLDTSRLDWVQRPIGEHEKRSRWCSNAFGMGSARVHLRRPCRSCDS